MKISENTVEIIRKMTIIYWGLLAINILFPRQFPFCPCLLTCHTVAMLLAGFVLGVYREKFVLSLMILTTLITIILPCDAYLTQWIINPPPLFLTNLGSKAFLLALLFGYGCGRFSEVKEWE